MAVTPERMTLAEFLALPGVKPARELRHGVECQKAPPSGPHSSIQSRFGAQVYNLGELREQAQTFTEARVILAGDTYVTDVVVYRWDRVPEDADGNLPRYFTSPPDLTLEILSPDGRCARNSIGAESSWRTARPFQSLPIPSIWRSTSCG